VPTTAEVTVLLKAWRGGDDRALDILLPIVHDELRRIARRSLRRLPPGAPVQATDILHEVVLRLVDVREVAWQNRTHFLAMCARLMRRVLVDIARSQHALKRGGGAIRVPLDEDTLPAATLATDLLRLNDALEDLATADPRKGQVVELRFFGGLSAEETAVALGVSAKTVLRDWEFARAWLRRELTRGGAV
jgi:RNA polymerase sigma factor (TIGR02999 family)